MSIKLGTFVASKSGLPGRTYMGLIFISLVYRLCRSHFLLNHLPCSRVPLFLAQRERVRPALIGHGLIDLREARRFGCANVWVGTYFLSPLLVVLRDRRRRSNINFLLPLVGPDLFALGLEVVFLFDIRLERNLLFVRFTSDYGDVIRRRSAVVQAHVFGDVPGRRSYRR